MSYYNLIKENYKFFRKQLEKESEKELETELDTELDTELETKLDTNLDINNEIPPNENLNGGSKSIKYQVIDIDWDDLLNENDEDIFLYSVSKDIEFNNKKIKEPTKEEVYDELLNNQQIEYSFTGEMDEINDQDIDENIDQDIDGINTIKETNIENILSNEVEKEFDENIEDYEDEISDSDDADDFDDTIIKEYFNKNESVSTLETNDETDLADIDNIINNYFESFENVQGGRSIDKIKEILADDTEYKNSLNLTGGNFKPIKKTKINRLYPYN